MASWKIATGVAVVAAVVAVGFAWHYRKLVPPPLLPAPKPRKPDDESTDLASLQFKKGAKAVAEASKQAQLGDVNAHDRAAAKTQLKGG